MGKVFRLHEGQTGTGWFVSNPITNNQLSTILTEGSELATSIPTPFARIDLFKSAFKWVTDNGITGETAYHKLVSEAFDVAQLFFFSPIYDHRIKIVSWSPQERLNNLKSNGSPKHQRFADTLSVFWNQEGDVKAFGFDKFNKFHFILNQANEVIGGTSPATLFFSAPDAAIKCNDITIAGFVLFDSIVPLHQRDPRFIKYFYTLQKQLNFAAYFPEVYSYLEEILLLLPQNLRVEIAAIQQTDINIYPNCLVNNNINDVCEVSGIKLGTTQGTLGDIENESDFVLQPEFKLAGSLPLILPNERFAQKWIYTTNGIFWDASTVIPPKEARNSKRLPVLENEYPWLTIDDFFEDKLIELPYEVEQKRFFAFGDLRVLLPVKPLFFKYFNSESLKNRLSGRALAAGGYEFKLNIPVKGGDLVFKKIYFTSDIVCLQLHLAVFPFVKVPSGDYYVALNDFSADTGEPIQVETYFNGKRNEDVETFIKNTKNTVDNSGKTESHDSIYTKSKEFDVIRVKHNDVNAILLPQFNTFTKQNQLSFAVDFGTTNTHIEFKTAQTVPQSFEYNNSSPIWSSLMSVSSSVDPLNYLRYKYFMKAIMPDEIGGASNQKFPLRTSIAYNNSVNLSQPNELFLHLNNYLLFGQEHELPFMTVVNNIKWSNYAKIEDRNLVEKYIEFLVQLIYYKSVLLSGQLNSVKIYWFYPVSMDQFERGVLANLWDDSYQRVFKDDYNKDNLISMPESSAPFLYYRANHPGLSLSIDVGGGSSDMALFQNASVKPDFITSFKFAGNSIFGDGYSDSPYERNTDSNGFVQSFKDSVLESISGDPVLEEYLESEVLNGSKKSADFCDRLFKLEESNNPKFNFTRELQLNPRLKLPIFLFYGALGFYAGNLFKRSGATSLPQNILFSGSASKTIKILCPEKENNIALAKLFEFLFEKISNLKVPAAFKILLSENPKEITCKGALLSNLNASVSNETNMFWMGGDNNGDELGKVIYEDGTDTTIVYKALLESPQLKHQILNSVLVYFQLLDEFVTQNDIFKLYGIDLDAYSRFKEIREINLGDYLEYGIIANNKKGDSPIEETMFFNPLIGVINTLAFELSK